MFTFFAIYFLLSYCWPVFYTSNFDQKSRVHWIFISIRLYLLWFCMKRNTYPNAEGTALLSISIEGIRGRVMRHVSLLKKFTNRVLENKKKYLQIKPRSCIILIMLCFLSFFAWTLFVIYKNSMNEYEIHFYENFSFFANATIRLV